MPRLAAKLLTAFQLTRLSLVFGAIADVWFVVLYTRADPRYALLPVNDIPLVVALVVAAVLSIGLFAFATTLNDLLDLETSLEAVPRYIRTLVREGETLEETAIRLS